MCAGGALALTLLAGAAFAPLGWGAALGTVALASFAFVAAGLAVTRADG